MEFQEKEGGKLEETSLNSLKYGLGVLQQAESVREAKHCNTEGLQRLRKCCNSWQKKNATNKLSPL